MVFWKMVMAEQYLVAIPKSYPLDKANMVLRCNSKTASKEYY